jgi:hypothetical protein
MKKIYEKPLLIRKGRLATVVAQSISHPAPPPP